MPTRTWIACLFGTLTAFAPNLPARAAERLILDVALGNSNVNFSPTSQPNQSTMLITRQFHCQLTRLVEGEVRGDAAAEFVFDHEHRQIVYTLKTGLTFSDGSPLRPIDVATTLQHFIKYRPFVRNVFAWIEKVEADAVRNQVRITYRRNPTLILKDLSIGLYPILRERDVAHLDKVNWTEPVGCGEYKIKSRTPTLIELVHRAEPTRRVRFKLFEDNELPPELAKTYDLIAMNLNGAIDPRLREVKIYDPYQIYVLINTAKPEWTDRRRRCQALASFRTERAVEMYAGKAVEADDYYPKGAFGYEVGSRYLELLRAQGRGPRLPMPKSACVAIVRVSVPKSMSPGYTSSTEMSDLKAVPILNAAASKDEFRRSKCDFMVMGLKSNTLDGYEFQIPLNEANTSFMQYVDPRLNGMIAAGQRQTDQKARYSQYRKISDAVAETCTIRPLITLPYKTIYVGRDLKISGLGDLPLNDVLLKWW